MLSVISLAVATLVSTASHAPLSFAARAVADSDSVLTVGAIAKMTTFATRLTKEPDSIRTAGRLAHHKTVAIQVGALTDSNSQVDMVAFAHEYPSIANDLAKAGLTARQWEQYRDQLVVTSIARQLGSANTQPGTALQANLTFWKTHEKVLDALQKAGMRFPKVETQGGGGMMNMNSDLNP